MITLKEMEGLLYDSLPLADYMRLCEAARRGVEAEGELNATKFIFEEYKQAHSKAAKWQQHYLERAEKAEADEQGLLEDIERLGVECDAALAELAAIKEERLALAKECVEAWESAVEWSGYASDYFREKHGVYKDQYRLDNARDRLVMLDVKQPSAISDEMVSVPRDRGDPMENWLMKPALEWLEEAEHGAEQGRCRLIRLCSHLRR